MHTKTLLGLAATAMSCALSAQSLISVETTNSRAVSRVDRATGVKTVYAAMSTNISTCGALAHDWINNVLYAASTSNDSLYTFDANTGEATLIGAFGDTTIVMHGMEFDSSTGTLYGVSGSTNNNLYTLDVNTGAETLVGSTGLSSFTNLCYDVLHDVMYATNSGSDSWYSIDRITGAATLIGALNGPTNPNGLAYDLATDTIYLADNSTDSLYTIDRVTGNATLIGSMGSGNVLGLVIIPPTGTYDVFGAGCAGTAGVPGNVVVATPNVGLNWIVNVTNLPFDAAIFIYGLSNTTSSLFGPLPFDMGLIGAPGCFARVDVADSFFLLGAGGTATFSALIPDDPATFVGLELFTQALSFDTVNSFGFTTSDAAAAVIGL
ncbi:MAG: hypothetical protein AB7O97_03900 [Planctomycetota bacterium]